MKFQMNKRITANSIYALIVICISILFFFFLSNFKFFWSWLERFLSILSPFIWGFALAYLFLRPLKFIEGVWKKYVFNKKEILSVLRVVSILTLLLIVGLFLYLLSSFVLPQLLESIDKLRQSLPGYIRSLQNMVNDLLKYSGQEQNINYIVTPYWDKILKTSTDIFSNIFMFIVNSSVSITSKILNVFLAFVVCIYVMFGKEKFAMQTKKMFYAFLPVKIMKKLLFTVNLIDDTFGRYVSGQLVDALVVGTLCAVSMIIFKLPYALLVGVIVACTNVIPMLGPIIGAVPSTFIILMAGKPYQALGFVVLILVIQQIDGNILVPRIVGSSTGISGFWVLFAIMVGGGLFGILGVVLCVPTLSVILKLLKIFAENRLQNKGLPVETISYKREGPFN